MTEDNNGVRRGVFAAVFVSVFLGLAFLSGLFAERMVKALQDDRTIGDTAYTCRAVDEGK